MKQQPWKFFSFRLRIALLSSTLSGALLLVLGALFWQLTDRMDLARVDRELRNLGSPQLERVNGPSHWERFESALAFVAGSRGEMTYIVWVRQDGRERHRSPGWPPGIDPERLPEPVAYAGGYHLSPGHLPSPPRRGEPISAANPALPLKEPRFVTVVSEGKRWRMAVLASPYTTMALGADLAAFTAGTAQLRIASLALLPVVLLLLGMGAWFLAARALQPLTLLTELVERVTVQGLDQRISSVPHDREFHRLITVFDQMLDRLETSFHQATRFGADAAHELRTPLTIMQVELELALLDAEPDSEHQRLFGRLIDETARLRSITDKLLLLAQADSGTLPIQHQSVDLSSIVQEAVEDLGILAPSVTVNTDIELGVRVSGDPHLLAAVVQNLTTNAVRHNTADGIVTVTLAAEDGRALLRVSNTGPGIAAADRGRVFDRFYRVDTSRSREHGGVGLGLSLSREIARAHGGDLELERSGPTETTFCLVLSGG